VNQAAKGASSRSRPSLLLLPVLLLAAGSVSGIAYLARARAERQLVAEAEGSGEPRPPLALQAEPPSEDEADPFLEKLLAAAEPADASVAALDAAAHALVARERFEEAEPLVLRALSSAPTDVEASIHQAVLKGVLGNEAGARAELERLAYGPAGWEASMFAAGFALRDGDDAAALRALRRFRAQAPAAEVTPEALAELKELEAREAHLKKKSPEK
jgi:tetratricopeptide (TPR) repeat protein